MHFSKETRLRSKGDDGNVVSIACWRRSRRRWRRSALRLCFTGDEGSPTTYGKSRQWSSDISWLYLIEPMLGVCTGESMGLPILGIRYVRPVVEPSELKDK